MCGIAGYLSRRGIDPALLRRMGDSIRHRGPDDRGEWLDEAAGVGFAHRRLAILDLSPAGHQPMQSADGRYVLSYNGEIYNHADIRRELDRDFGPLAWRGHSDTETLVEAIARWGLEATLGKCVGMFALSLWDAKDRKIQLARDRFGEKPLYYGWVGGDLVFGSELAAIQLNPRFDNRIDPAALRIYAARSYVPAPLSIYQHIYKLPPGSVLTASVEATGSRPSAPPEPGFADRHLKIEPYWSYRQAVLDGLEQPFEDEGEALEALEAALSQAVTGQSLADVPVGAFLSGGIDSSTVVALYQKYSTQPVRTYTIGFDDPAYNEAPAAKAVAEHLGTQHHELYLTDRDAREVIPKLASIYGEPFADSSQIPTYLVSAFARQQVTVALSGDGGDELFGGYHRHIFAPRFWGRIGPVPRPLRRALFGSLSVMPRSLLSACGALAGLSPLAREGDKIRKFARVASTARSFDEVADSFLDEWYGTASPLVAPTELNEWARVLPPETASPIQIMYRDAVSYLPDDILCKVDRASMAVSLESRVPYLDHRVAAVAARIPLAMKIRGGRGKHILRELLYREAPRELFERPKAGFAIPVGQWIKGPLRDWAEELLRPAAMAEAGWFEPSVIQQRWRDHLSGRRDSTAALWAVLMFQAWWRENRQGSLNSVAA
jgi:asparagine synthase (glutamine-hydrolysing)